jgi:hypothetical protein
MSTRPLSLLGACLLLTIAIPSGSAFAETCAKGDLKACLDGAAVAKKAGDHEARAMHLIHACDLGHAQACQMAATQHLRGTGVPQSLEVVSTYWEKGCGHGALEGCANLAMYHSELRGKVPADLKKSRGYATVACPEGDPFKTVKSTTGCRMLGGMQVKGMGGERLYKAGRDNLALAYDADDGLACHVLGGAHYGGQWGLEPNRLAAETLWGRACRVGEKAGCKAMQGDHWQGDYCPEPALIGGKKSTFGALMKTDQRAYRLARMHSYQRVVDKTDGTIGRWHVSITDIGNANGPSALAGSLVKSVCDSLNWTPVSGR